MFATHARPVAAQAATASHTLTDLTGRPRVGVRGADSRGYLQAHGFTLPERPNQATSQGDACLVAALSQTEFLVLAGEQETGDRVASLEASWELSSQANYLLPRQDSHAWLMLRGPRSGEVMAKVCAVDLRPQCFEVGCVAQTSVARVNAIVIHGQIGGEPAYHLLFDRCSLAYMEGALCDALEEFNGTAKA